MEDVEQVDAGIMDSARGRLLCQKRDEYYRHKADYAARAKIRYANQIEERNAKYTISRFIKGLRPKKSTFEKYWDAIEAELTRTNNVKLAMEISRYLHT